MKQILPLLLLGTAGVAAAANPVYTSPGNGTNFTFAELAKIADSGVIQKGDTFQVTKDIDIVAGDALKLDNKAVVMLGDQVLVRVKGSADFAPADTATIMPITPGNKTKGVMFSEMTSDIKVARVHFEEAGVRFGGPAAGIIEGCSFYNHNGEGAKNAISFVGSGRGNIVRNNRIINAQFAAIGTGSNIAAGKIIENNYMENCCTQNRNYPIINEIPGGDNGDVIIRNNKVIGGKYLMSGALSVSNMLSMLGENKVVIEGNYLSDSRYGINIFGNLMDVVVKNNEVINCHYESNANNGGSGITIYSTKEDTGTKCYVEGNVFDGSLWGATVIGPCHANFGKVTVDESLPEYNPGNNTFRNNGNCGMAPEGQQTAFDPSIPYDLYNNSTLTLYAQGNFWGGTDQSPEEIEKRIFHKKDKEDLGEVIFLPAGEVSGLTTVETTDGNFEIFPLGNGTFRVVGVADDAVVEIYSLSGAKLASGSASEVIAATPGETLIVKVGNKARTIIL